jgi:hypothetical protein
MNNLDTTIILSKNLNWWLLKEIGQQLYIVKLDILSTFKIALAYELLIFRKFSARIHSLVLTELQQRFEVVENISIDYEIAIEKGKALQNKLRLKNSENDFELYFVFRDTTAAEKLFNKYHNCQINIKDSGWE